MNQLLEEVLKGRRRAIARVITQVENDPDAAREAIAALHSSTGHAHVVGVTGPPGSGKSTLVNQLALIFRQWDRTVAIVAIDPTSPFTGGALLGDRIRMRDLSGDRGIFIRSMASRGSLGGLASATRNVVKVLDAAGFQIIMVETVGAGQAEVDIASAAHTTVVIEAPGMGDDIQTIKAGILEIADILVVNKADRPGSDRTVKSLRMMLHMGEGARMAHHGREMEIAGSALPADRRQSSWKVPLHETVALEGHGVEDVANSIISHRTHLKDSGEWSAREIDRSRQEIRQLLQQEFLERISQAVPLSERDGVVLAVADRRMNPYEAVRELMERVES